jgi:hypothetical protein
LDAENAVQRTQDTYLEDFGHDDERCAGKVDQISILSRLRRVRRSSAGERGVDLGDHYRLTWGIQIKPIQCGALHSDVTANYKLLPNRRELGNDRASILEEAQRESECKLSADPSKSHGF